MKDAHGHGSESRGGNVVNIADRLYGALKPPSMIPGYPSAPAHQGGTNAAVPHIDDMADRLRAGVLPSFDNVPKLGPILTYFGRAAKRARREA